MRISDWSSDVCSSDLAVRVYGETGEDGPRITISAAGPRGARALAGLDEYAITRAFLDDAVEVEGDFLELMALRPFLSDRHPWLLLLRFAIPLLRGQVASDNRVVPRHYDHGNERYFAFLEIGRASCRDRVCQYV